MTSDVLRADAARLREMAGAEREAMIPLGDRWVTPSKLYMEHIAMLERAALASEMMAAMMERASLIESPGGTDEALEWYIAWQGGTSVFGATLPLALLPLLNHVDERR
jgi:hypothetical protein